MIYTNEDLSKDLIENLNRCFKSLEILNKKELGFIILIADDNIDILNLYELTFREKFNIITVNNGKDALNKIKDGLLAGLILLDVQMPIMNGIEAAKEIKKINQSLNIIITSSNYEYEKDANEIGCKFIYKPYLFKFIIGLSI